jgi:DNA-binding NarL/FixJ family response regulator
VVVEDNVFFRAGLVRVLPRLGIHVAGEAGTGEEAVAVVAATRPDVVLMDLHLPDTDGAATTARIMAGTAPPSIVMLTVSTQGRDLQRSLRAGATGYLLKDTPAEQIAEAIRSAARGDAPMSPPMTRQLVERVRDLAPPSSHDGPVLSERELAVLRLLARGLDNAAIGAKLAISGHTVKSHVSSLLLKLGVANRVQAAAEAVRRGLV